MSMVRGMCAAYGIDELFSTIRTISDFEARRNLERRHPAQARWLPAQEYDANLLFVARRRLDNAGPLLVCRKITFTTTPGRGLCRSVTYHQPLRRVLGCCNDVQFDFVYQKQSDRDVNLDNFTSNYNSQNQNKALLTVSKATDNTSFELLMRADPQSFDSSPPRSPFDYGTFTGYEPAATYSMAPTELGDKVFMSGELQAARMHRYFDRDIYNQQGFDADRLSGKVDFQRPFDACFTTITPHLGTQQAFYDNSRNTTNTLIDPNDISGKSIEQGALTYALDMDTRLYGNYMDWQNPSLGIDGMRHIIEPRFEYTGVSSTNQDPVRVLDFDQMDDLIHKDTITFSFDQTFQTPRPNRDGNGLHTVSLAGFDMMLDYLPNHEDQARLLDGHPFGLLRVQGFLRILDNVRLDGGVGMNPQNFQTETSNYSVTFDTHERWRMLFQERFSYSDYYRAINGSDQYRFRIEYELSDRWAMAYEAIHEKKATIFQVAGTQQEQIELTRKFGPFNVSVGYQENVNLNEHGYYGNFRPMIMARNLIVPKNDPLVNPAQVTGEAEEPEERNYDPFMIYKKQKMEQKKFLKEKNTDVPAPPPATSQNGARDPNPPRRWISSRSRRPRRRSRSMPMIGHCPTACRRRRGKRFFISKSFQIQDRPILFANQLKSCAMRQR